MKALATELDSMASLLEVLHQNSISLRDPQAISEELDTIVRQSEDSERVVREMEALLRSDGGDVERGRARRRPRRRGQGAADPDAAAAESEGPVSTPFGHYPRWAQTLAHGIRARLGNTFILHGNTHDVVPLPPTDPRRRARLRAADRVPRRLDVRPARRGDRVPARQRRRPFTPASRTSTSPTPWRWSTPCTAPTWRDRCRAIRRCSSRCSIRS